MGRTAGRPKVQLMKTSWQAGGDAELLLDLGRKVPFFKRVSASAFPVAPQASGVWACPRVLTSQATSLKYPPASPRERPLKHAGLLREPVDLGAAIDHAHAHLEDRRRLARSVVEGLLPVDCRGGEGILDSAAESISAPLPEALRQRRTREAAPDGRLPLRCERA